jgi:dTDP-4-amino-4,6-dideoxygalactose transaminase
MALERQHAPLMPDLRAAFDRVVGASSYILGSEVEAFEAEFADYCGAEHCVGVASGTAALTIALLAAGIGPGDEVIVPGHTFIASALAVVHAGATPVFCDVEEGTGLIDARSAASVVSERTAGLVAVHLYGQACDMDALWELADHHGLLLVEDAAQAHGATYRGQRAGSLGDVAGFSFYPSKNLGAMGDGGAICTSSPEIAERAARLRHLGQRRKGEHIEAGFNERLDGLQAALLRVKLPHLDAWNHARRAHAECFTQALAGRVRMLEERESTPCIYHLFPVRVEDREGLREHLGSAGVHTGVHYAPAAHAHPAWEGVVDRLPVDLPIADAWAAEELSLPMFPELAPAEIEHVIEACASWADM